MKSWSPYVVSAGIGLLSWFAFATAAMLVENDQYYAARAAEGLEPKIGAIMVFGARIAGGCTSGHGISGTLQLAVQSWTFILLAFAVAIATAFLYLP